MTIRIANAPVSWAIYEFSEIEQKYPFTRVLDEIAETGYTGTELGPWNYFPTDPNALRPELDKRGLQMVSAFVPVKFLDAADHEAGEAHALKVGRLLAALGSKLMILADDGGRVPELVNQAGQRHGSWLSPEQWDAYAAGVNRIARKVYDELGLKATFHHHCAGYVETPEETRHLMQRTDADLVGLCLDTGHWEFAGGDSLQAVKEYGTRINHLHFKDCDPNIHQLAKDEKLKYFEAVQAGIFPELGQGSVDFKGVIDEMQRLGYDGWGTVEQDVLTDDLDAPRHSARSNREYLRKLGL
jgi:inosose dehydratase